MNRTMSYLQCEKTFAAKGRAFGLADLVGKFKTMQTRTIGAMASSCSWSPEATTDALPEETTPIKLSDWPRQQRRTCPQHQREATPLALRPGTAPGHQEPIRPQAEGHTSIYGHP